MSDLAAELSRLGYTDIRLMPGQSTMIDPDGVPLAFDTVAQIVLFLRMMGANAYSERDTPIGTTIPSQRPSQGSRRCLAQYARLE